VALRPALRVVFMSGYADDAAFREQAGDADVPFVPKPFDPLQLRAKVREALDARR
jgi:CheY-like chemotaxis protein